MNYAYELIKGFYADQRAKRSSVPLMDHIDQGLIILDAIGASARAKDAYCLHPMFQADEDLLNVGRDVAVSYGDGFTIVLVMEYRQWANAWLSDKVREVVMVGSAGNEIRTGHIEQIGSPASGPLVEVKHMLITDKVQNYKDFLTHHYGRHERSVELDIYFKTWLHVLGISRKRFLELCALIDSREA